MSDSLREVCARGDLVRGRVRTCALPRSPEGFPREAMVIEDMTGVVRAFINECKHLPIPLDAGSGEYLTEDGMFFLCSTHGAMYRVDDGYCIEGPCQGSSLNPLPVVIENGRVFLKE